MLEIGVKVSKIDKQNRDGIRQLGVCAGFASLQS